MIRTTRNPPRGRDRVGAPLAVRSGARTEPKGDHRRVVPPAAARALGALLGALSAVLLATAVPAPAGAAPDPTVAPAVTLSADGRSATDGTRTLAVSQAAGLDAAGAAVAVSGNGYDVKKGIYLAMCVVPPPNHQPSPCGGGADRTGASGASQWISSDPPASGVGLSQPYGPGGSFSVRLHLSPVVAPGIDCRQVRCAIVTRSDHTRTADRSQDILVPISFRADPVTAATPPSTTVAGPAPRPAPVPTIALPTTTKAPTTLVPTITVPPPAPTTTTLPAPTATVAADGLSVSDGIRTLRVSATTGLAEGETVHVAGTGFDPARGVYISLCVLPDAVPGAAAPAPGPCQSGAPAVNRWISSSPPAYAVGSAQAFGPGGSFAVDLDLVPLIADGADCRVVRCGIGARADDIDPADRRSDLLLPVAFAAPSSTGTSAAPVRAPSTTAVAAPAGELASAPAAERSRPRWWVGGLVVVGLGAGLAIAMGVRRRADGSGGSS